MFFHRDDGQHPEPNILYNHHAKYCIRHLTSPDVRSRLHLSIEVTMNNYII